MQRIIAVTLVLLVSGRIIPLYGQFIWHPDGQGGYNAGIQTSVQSGALGVGGIGGYSLWGVLDLNFSAEQFFLSDKLSNQSISASQVQPSATLIGFGGSPLSVIVHAAYTIERYHSSAFDTQPNTLNANYFSFFYGFEIRARLSPSLMSEPTFGIGYVQSAPNPINGYDTPLSSPESRTPIIFAFPMFFQSSSQGMFTILPNLRFYPGEAIEPDQLELYVTVGFFFPTSSDE